MAERARRAASALGYSILPSLAIRISPPESCHPNDRTVATPSAAHQARVLLGCARRGRGGRGQLRDDVVLQPGPRPVRDPVRRRVPGGQRRRRALGPDRRRVLGPVQEPLGPPPSPDVPVGVPARGRVLLPVPAARRSFRNRAVRLVPALHDPGPRRQDLLHRAPRRPGRGVDRGLSRAHLDLRLQRGRGDGGRRRFRRVVAAGGLSDAGGGRQRPARGEPLSPACRIRRGDHRRVP